MFSVREGIKITLVKIQNRTLQSIEDKKAEHRQPHKNSKGSTRRPTIPTEIHERMTNYVRDRNAQAAYLSLR